MKTIQISDELWKRLRLEAAVSGVPMRQVIEEVGAQSERLYPRTAGREGMSESAMASLKQALGLKTGRELTVEMGGME